MEVISARVVLGLLHDKHDKDVFVAECKNGPSDNGYRRMDAWVMKRSYAHPLIVGYEIKVNRSDFIGDEKWHKYLPYCNEFYFVCPAGLIAPEELPAEVGLMLVSKNGNRLFIKRKAAYRKTEAVDMVRLMTYIIMSRSKIIGTDLNEYEAVYGGKRQQWERWLADQKIDLELGYKVSSALTRRTIEEIGRARQENQRLQTEIEGFVEIRDLCKELNIRPGGWTARRDLTRKHEELISCLPDGFMDNLTKATNSLSALLDAVKQMEEKSP